MQIERIERQTLLGFFQLTYSDAIDIGKKLFIFNENDIAYQSLNQFETRRKIVMTATLNGMRDKFIREVDAALAKQKVGK